MLALAHWITVGLLIGVLLFYLLVLSLGITAKRADGEDRRRHNELRREIEMRRLEKAHTSRGGKRWA